MAARHTATRFGRTRGWGHCPVGPCMLQNTEVQMNTMETININPNFKIFRLKYIFYVFLHIHYIRALMHNNMFKHKYNTISAFALNFLTCGQTSWRPPSQHSVRSEPRCTPEWRDAVEDTFQSPAKERYKNKCSV